MKKMTGAGYKNEKDFEIGQQLAFAVQFSFHSTAVGPRS